MTIDPQATATQLLGHTPDVFLFDLGRGRTYYRSHFDAAGTANWANPMPNLWTRRDSRTEEDRTFEPSAPSDIPEKSPIQEKIDELVLLGEDWDSEGAEAIPDEVAKRAGGIAESVSDIAGDPFIAPAPDGSVFLEWEFPSKASIAIFVEDEVFPPAASVKIGGKVHRVRINSERLRLILKGLQSRDNEVTKLVSNW